MSRVLSKEKALTMGFPSDKRKRRRRHRAAARKLLTNGGIFNGFSCPGSGFWQVASWHLEQARYL